MKRLIQTLLLLSILALLFYHHRDNDRTTPAVVPMPVDPASLPAERALRPDTAAAAQLLATPLEADSLPQAPAPPDSGLAHPSSLQSSAPRLNATGFNATESSATESSATESSTERASFSVKVRDAVIPYAMFGVFAMPGEQIDIEALFTRPGEAYELVTNHGLTAVTEAGGWMWTAPEEPGTYRIAVAGPYDAVVLQVFVKTPFDPSARELEGYRIGAYQAKPLRNNPRFAAPQGLIRVTDENRDQLVSPHFTLGMFTCKQPGDPKFVLVDEHLLLKLEMLLEELNNRGVAASTFTVMSAYRTPWYNRSIGNTTTYSQHLFGRAADIYVDENQDGRMDDLDGNGTIGTGDARFLADLINDLGDEPSYQPFVGGLGLYGPKPHRGPFVHVDVRGYRARW